MSIKSYKGFNKDMTCKGFRYKENESYECDSAKCGNSGFHACEFPLEVFAYYEPTCSVYHEVEQSGQIDKSCYCTKTASSKIKIGAKISIVGLIEATINFIKERCHRNTSSTGEYSVNSSTEDYSVNSSTGKFSVNSSIGEYSANSSTGECSINSSIGDYSANRSEGIISINSSIGDYSANSSTGYGSANLSMGRYSANSLTEDYSVNSSIGYCSANSSTGKYSVNSSIGDYSANSSTGYGSANLSTGDNSTNSGEAASINVGWGKDNKCKGAIGSYLVLSEWGSWDGEKFPLLHVKMEFVDGERIKANVWYKLKDGEFVIVT